MAEDKGGGTVTVQSITAEPANAGHSPAEPMSK
jgi:hypothetical protein